MRLFPILGVKETIPYDLIKKHEKQVLINHCKQTIDRLAMRGGLSYQEIYAVLHDKHYKDISSVEDEEVKKYVMDEINKFSKWSIDHEIKAKELGLRPCIYLDLIETNSGKTQGWVGGYFHRWVDQEDGTNALIENDDGCLFYSFPRNMKFTDR